MTTLVIPTEASMIVSGPPQGQWTAADWETLPDDGNRYEIIDGVLYKSTSPSYYHQWIIKLLARYIGTPAEEQGLAYVDTAPIGLFMPGCDPVQPDFVVVLAERASIIHDRRIWGVPDLIIEVLSPGNASYDIRVKLPAYAKAGVPEYGIINPAERKLSLFQLEAPGRYHGERIFNEGDTVTFACLPTLPLVVGRLFEGAPDTTL